MPQVTTRELLAAYDASHAPRASALAEAAVRRLDELAAFNDADGGGGGGGGQAQGLPTTLEGRCVALALGGRGVHVALTEDWGAAVGEASGAATGAAAGAPAAFSSAAAAACDGGPEHEFARIGTRELPSPEDAARVASSDLLLLR